MYNICVFAGTTEGRELVTFLSNQKVALTACVATEYGETLLQHAAHLKISAERLSRADMIALFEQERFDLVVDATHPYATEVTEEIHAACEAAGCAYLRLLRDAADAAYPEGTLFAASAQEAAALLNDTEGNVLLTTGSKELAAFRGVSGFAERVYARVLPTEASLEACRAVGLPQSHVLAMQGPFSEELNLALLHSTRSRYLVTKDGGTVGGMAEKIKAAEAAGARLIVIGRPPQREGLPYGAVLKLLCERFFLQWKPSVKILGIGPGARDSLTQEARLALEEAELVIGARRMLELARAGQPTVAAVRPADIAAAVEEHPEYRKFAVVMSGDTGFFSGTKKLLPLLSDCDVQVLAGISSLSYLCARLQTSYEDVYTTSLHGRTGSILPDVQTHRRVFTLVGGENSTEKLCCDLIGAGLGAAYLSVGENLSYPEERITTGTAEELAGCSFAPLSAVLVENSEAEESITFGLPDEAFLRGGEVQKVPMTKSEVRAVCLSKLRLTADAVCWDVGAGTGSVSVELARLARRGRVYAIEQKAEAVALLEENRRSFGLANLEIITGSAPAACADLPAPTHVFIGGSGGNLRDIIKCILEKNPAARIVATAIALETAAELTACLREFPFVETEVVSLSVARAKKAGPYHLMQGQNPIYIFSMQAGGTEV